MKLKPFTTIGGHEASEVNAAIKKPLSRYLAGQNHDGGYVQALEGAWQWTFKVKHAIACNSATSGLLAAAFVIGLKPGDRFAVPAMTMSATAAAPMFTGAKPFFADVDDETFGITGDLPHDAPVFATNLFGHPAHLIHLRHWCDKNRTVLIEDNSQSPFASVGSLYAGTIGHIGVFSLNVHKPLQCGEGGMIVTNDDLLAEKLRAFINHGEHRGPDIGLNLRMPEVCAAIALVQLQRGEEIVQGRIDQAQAILAAIGEVPGLRKPITRRGCSHSFYGIPFLVEENRRSSVLQALAADGVPLLSGYVPPLYRLPAFARYARQCPVAESLHDNRLFVFENCAYDVSDDQITQIGEAFHKAFKK